jgi:hypothetical protein
MRNTGKPVEIIITIDITTQLSRNQHSTTQFDNSVEKLLA